MESLASLPTMQSHLTCLIPVVTGQSSPPHCPCLTAQGRALLPSRLWWAEVRGQLLTCPEEMVPSHGGTPGRHAVLGLP